jgi:hypothetical protein
VPAFEVAVGLYDAQVQDFGELTAVLVYSNACINAALVVGIAFFVLRALLAVIQTVQYKYISGWLALSLPLGAVKKVTPSLVLCAPQRDMLAPRVFLGARTWTCTQTRGRCTCTQRMRRADAATQ